MSSGMQKPPLAPKPRLTQPLRPGLSPSTSRRDDFLCPVMPRRVKPALAPKPNLPKPTTAVESESLDSKTPNQTSITGTTRTQSILNSQQGLQQENKKPDWDYIIPICLCSHENCTCIRNTSAGIGKMDKDLKMLVKGKPEENKQLPPPSGDTTDNSEEKMIFCSTDTHLANHKPPPETFDVNKNPKTDARTVTVGPSHPHRTWSDEASGNKTSRPSPGGGTEDDAISSEGIYLVPKSEPVPVDLRKQVHVVAVPRKPRKAVLTQKENVEEEKAENLSQEGRDMHVKKVKVSSAREGNSTLSAGRPVEMQPVFLSAPAPPSRKKPLLSAPEKAVTFAAQTEGEDLGRDSSSQEMEVSFDKDGDEVEREGMHEQEEVYTDFTHSPPSSILLSHPPPTTVAAVDVPARVAPNKPQRRSSMLSVQRNNKSPEEKEHGPLEGCAKRQDCVLRELPLPPEKISRNPLTAGAIKPSRPSLSKTKSKSFSGADFVRSDGQKRYSFRKLLDMKLAVKMLPRITGKGGRSPDDTANDNEQSVDGPPGGQENLHEHFWAERKLSDPQIKVEQSVDGHEFSPGIEQEPYYENIALYEEIPIYMNVDVERVPQTSLTSYPQPTPWPMYDETGIYEEHEPYVPFKQQPCQPPERERSSVEEEVAPPDDGLSDDFTFSYTSDEEDNSSSISSKGDAEQPEQSSEKTAQKKKKIHHIVTEIMSSESVFVDVLKLLHVDFRDVVSKASRSNGKPVIEERLLNQILYYLPQLYELNQDLLRELTHRVAKWDENSRLSDIFLKKGPYLKMYATYISGFDKNVALLVEQSKRNPAFGAVVREFEASPRCANLALKHYLLKPVQRIPQYQLLLTDYLKNLSEESDDYNDTQAALALVKEVASHANDILKQGDNFQKLIQVQCNLTSHHEIVQPGRVFLKEGILKKLSRKVMQPRMFFLFNDTLLHTIPVQSGQYKLKNMWSLAGMKVSKPSQEAYQNELNIESVERSFILSASSATERDEWLEAISTAISDYTKKKISFLSGKPPQEVMLQGCSDGTPLGFKAPIWIPDPRTTMCMICACEFTLTWRRHHCRACGKVVCQSCSSNKCCLPYRNNRLGRVCDQCFPVLQQQKSERDMSTAVPAGTRTHFAFNRKQKKIPAALKEVSASTHSSMSGYLQRSKSKKKQGKRLWFVIKDKVLYTYAASEDVAALESQPLLGFVLKVDSSKKLQFKLYHKNTLYYIFKADDIPAAQRWIASFKDATVL